MSLKDPLKAHNDYYQSRLYGLPVNGSWNSYLGYVHSTWK